ncbi:aspartic peptidase domain-containing protein [Nemania abortiva]|nr:aspartic peptidase domain-containing protein [Nemania abortiva]
MAFTNFSSCIVIFLATLITLNYVGPYLMISLGHGSKKGTRIVSFPLVAGPQQLSVTRRAEYVYIQLNNYPSSSYYIELSIGTPPQDVQAWVATSLSSLWVTAACDPGFICDPMAGNYKPENSTSSSSLLRNNTLTLNYPGNIIIELEYYKDTYSLSTGLTVQDVEFGVAKSAGFDNGVLGLGFPDSSDPSPGFIAQLTSQRIINSKAFSLVLSNSSAANSGVIIFGGVDTKKFSGSLSVNKIITDNQNDYTINMDGVSVGTLDNDSVTNLTASPATVIISSAYAGITLPNSTIEILSGYFNARISGNYGPYYVLSCAMAANSSSFLSFNFAGVAIEIPFSALVYPIEGDLCQWALQSNVVYEGKSVLGRKFLHHAYAVFDQTLMTVSLSQYVDCGTHVQEIESWGVGNFVGECPPARSVTPAKNSSSTPSSPGLDLSSSSPSGLSSGAKAGIGVGVAVGVIAVVALAYLMLAANKRRQANIIRESQDIPPYKPETMEQPRPNEVLHEMYSEQSPSIHSPDALHSTASTH